MFLFAGFAASTWAALVPFAKDRASIDDGTLGLLLLCLGAGSIVSMPLTGAAAGRFGCRPVMILAGLGVAATLPLLAYLSTTQELIVALTLFGAAIGALDVAVNIQAVIVERASGRALMSGFHGLFSLGGICGAGGMAALMSLGATPLLATFVVVAGLLAAIAFSVGGLLPYGARKEGPAFAIPRGIVLAIGLLCFAVFMAEGAIMDWSGVFLTAERGLEDTRAGLGYAAFAATMTLFRLTGDWIVHRLGARRIILWGGLCAAVGFLIATALPFWQAALVGYAMIGVGLSNVVPILYSAVGRQSVMPESVAVPAITTLGYAGILLGPAGIGFIAKETSLPMAFLILGAMMVGVALSRRVPCP